MAEDLQQGLFALNVSENDEGDSSSSEDVVAQMRTMSSDLCASNPETVVAERLHNRADTPRATTANPDANTSSITSNNIILLPERSSIVTQDLTTCEGAQYFASGNIKEAAVYLASKSRELQDQQKLKRTSHNQSSNFMLEHITSLLASNKDPIKLALDLLSHKETVHSPGEKFDLQAMLLLSLQRMIGSQFTEVGYQEIDSTELKAEELLHASRILTKPEYKQLASSKVEAGVLSPRAMELIVSVFDLTVSRDVVRNKVEALFREGRSEEASRYLTRLKMCDLFSVEEVINPLVTAKKVGAAILFAEHYTAAAPTLVALVAEDHRNGGGGDPNLARKLIYRLSLDPYAFPRVEYLRRKAVVRWCAAIGKLDDYAMLLCDVVDSDTRLAQHSRNCVSTPNSSSSMPKSVDDYTKLDSHHQQQLKRFVVRAALKEYQRVAKSYSLANSSLEFNRCSMITPEARHATMALKYMKCFGLSDDDEFKDTYAKLAPIRFDMVSEPASASSGSFLTMDMAKIVIINDEKAVEKLQRAISNENNKLVGVDLEHLPDSVKGMHPLGNHCQLLQIAFKSSASELASDEGSCFIVDFQLLPSLSSLNGVLVQLFTKASLVKVGMGFGDDLRKMREEFPPSSFAHACMRSYADLTPVKAQLSAAIEAGKLKVSLPGVSDNAGKKDKSLKKTKDQQRDAHRQIQTSERKPERPKNCPQSLTNTAPSTQGVSTFSSDSGDESKSEEAKEASVNSQKDNRSTKHKHAGRNSNFNAAKKEGGLAGLVRMCFGVGLDKDEQVSNWALRPLRPSQLLYAALDAQCLLDISDWLGANTKLRLSVHDVE